MGGPQCTCGIGVCRNPKSEACRERPPSVPRGKTLAEDLGLTGSLNTLAFRGGIMSGAIAEASMSVPGYESLASVLLRAYDQAALGKGKERHAGDGEPFDAQVMQDMARRFGVGSLLGQAFKKSEESQRLALEPAVRELIGAINYLAGAVIALEKNSKESK